jgi:hypothetical protein
LTRSDLICKDPLFEDSDSLSTQVPSTLDYLPHIQPICTHHYVGTNTLLFSTPKTPFSSTVPQTLFEIVDPPLRQSIHIRKSTELLDFAYSCYSSSFTFFLVYIHCLSKPSSYKESIHDPFLQQAMDDELSTLHKTDTWNLVPLPPSKSVDGYRWVYKIKTNSDEFIERYKARLVVKGYSQYYGMDYEEIFVLVVKMITIRTFIVIASVRRWHISQLDVKNAFLNGDLQEKFIWRPLLVFHMTLGMFVSSRKRYMVSNKHLVLGFRNFLL